MTVFNCFMKMVKKNTGMIVMYLAIFMGITIMIQSTTKDSDTDMYQSKSIKVGIVDEDQSALSKGLREYLGQIHELKTLENKKSVLQENLYYQNVEYIITIPKHYEENYLEKGERLAIVQTPGSFTGVYVTQQINSYLNSVKTYAAAGYSVQHAALEAGKTEGPRVKMLDVNGNAGKLPGYAYYYRFLPYLMLLVLCYILGNILSNFRKEDIQKRVQASALSSRRQNLETLLAVAVLGIGLWIIAIAGAVLLYGKEMLASHSLHFYLLNSIAMLLVALSIAFLIGMISEDNNALNGIVNLVSLGMCFLCGVFVPIEVISPSVQKVVQFLPVYWYEIANNKLAEFETITGSVRTEVLGAIVIQVVFAIAILCVAGVLSRRKLVQA